MTLRATRETTVAVAQWLTDVGLRTLPYDPANPLPTCPVSVLWFNGGTFGPGGTWRKISYRLRMYVDARRDEQEAQLSLQDLLDEARATIGGDSTIPHGVAQSVVIDEQQQVTTGVEHDPRTFQPLLMVAEMTLEVVPWHE